MKESEKILNECKLLVIDLDNCVKEESEQFCCSFEVSARDASYASLLILARTLSLCWKEVSQNGWKARYLGYCIDLQQKLTKCKMRHQRDPKTSSPPTRTGSFAGMSKRVTPIEDSFEKQEHYLSVTERYYNRLFYLNSEGPPSEHHCVLVHTNKICLVTLAPTHPIVKEKKKISKLDFQVTNKLDRLENKVSGKGKKGGQHIMPDSALCFVECKDGSKYTVWGCIKGKLVEINALLLTKPDLMAEKPLSQGYVAVVLPSIKDLDVYKSRLLTLERYENETVQK